MSLPCSGKTDLFYAHMDQRLELKQAKALCLECPLKVECREASISRREIAGVWGGLDEMERRREIRRRRRGTRGGVYRAAQQLQGVG